MKQRCYFCLLIIHFITVCALFPGLLLFPYFLSFIVFSFVFFLQVLCSQPGVSSPDWQLDQDWLVVEGGEFGLGLCFSGLSEAAAEPCQPRGVRMMRS